MIVTQHAVRAADTGQPQSLVVLLHMQFKRPGGSAYAYLVRITVPIQFQCLPQMIAYRLNGIGVGMMGRETLDLQPLLRGNSYVLKPALLVKTQHQSIGALPGPAGIYRPCGRIQTGLAAIRHEQGMALLAQLQVVIPGPACASQARRGIVTLPIPVALQLQQGPGFT